MYQFIFYCLNMFKVDSGNLKSDSASSKIINSVQATFMINSYTINGMVPTASKYSININHYISTHFSVAVNRSSEQVPVLILK